MMLNPLLQLSYFLDNAFVESLSSGFSLSNWEKLDTPWASTFFLRPQLHEKPPSTLAFYLPYDLSDPPIFLLGVRRREKGLRTRLLE